MLYSIEYVHVPSKNVFNTKKRIHLVTNKTVDQVAKMYGKDIRKAGPARTVWRGKQDFIIIDSPEFNIHSY